MSISSIGGSNPFTTAGMMRLNTPTDPSATGAKSARDEFLDYVKLTPAEKMRAALLAKLGLKEEDLKGMSADERQAVENKIKKMIKDEVENSADKRPGQILDVTA